MAKIPQTPRKRRKRSIAQQKEDVDEYKTLCFVSLCQKLAQCKLMIIKEAELVEAVVKLESLDILRRVIGGKLLPLKMRIILLSFALQEQGTKCLDSAVQHWIQEVSEKILEEMLEATATGGSSEPPAKKARRKLSNIEVQEIGRVDECCEFCRNGANTASLRFQSEDYLFFMKCMQETARILDLSGDSCASNKAMIALSAFQTSLPAAGLSICENTERKKKRANSFVRCEVVNGPLMSKAAYEQICRRMVLSSAETLRFTTDVYQKMWTSIWERELKNVVKVGQITLADAICHCSKADAFTSAALLSGVKKKIRRFPGFCIVMEVICSTSVYISGIIATFADIWRVGYSGTLVQVMAPRSVVTSSTKQILRSYLSKLLQSTKIRFEVGPSSPLKLLFVLYKIFFVYDHEKKQDRSYTKHWDVLMSQLINDTSAQTCKQDGRNWCLFLEKCVLEVDAESAEAMRSRDHFLQALKIYCLTIMHSVIATGGKIISSGGLVRRQLIGMEGDRATVRKALAQMITTFGEKWISGLIARLLRSSTQLCNTGENEPRGIRRLLFPALVVGMKSTSKANPKRRKTGQQLFTGIIHAVNAILKDSESTPLYLVALMRFCESWDIYQKTHTKAAPVGANRWGFRAMVELDMLPELLLCYGTTKMVRQETKATLIFAAEVLQNVPNCPSTLEKTYFKVLSDIKAGVEHMKLSIARPEKTQLVLHSSAVLHRLLCAIKYADAAQTRVLIDEMKNTARTLGEFRQQLEQWFSFVEVYGASFAGKESRMELSLLCTRLIQWYPEEFGSMRYAIMTPLDSHFVFVLKLFVKEAARVNTIKCPSLMESIPLPSAVRVEMALHLYLTTATFPDFETLTVVLTKAIVKCRSPDAFGDLTKIARKNGHVLLFEAAVATLSSSLRGLKFSDSALNQHVELIDKTELKIYARHSKALIYQENTLKLLADSALIFKKGIAWSVLLFNETSATIWLPYFFEYILKTEVCGGALRVDMLLTTLEKLTLNNGERELRSAYWLAALLNTALITCSSRSAGVHADVDIDLRNRLRRITGKLLHLQAIAPETSNIQKGDRNGDTFALFGEKMLGLVHLTRCARVNIEENEASWICEHQIELKTATALRLSVLDVWRTDMEKSMEVGPPIHLFLPFVHWVSGALIYSQSFLEEPSAVMRRWERTFTSYVTDVYLHVEFEDVTCDLLKTWLTTWITCNLARGQDNLQLLALLPSQVALFRRLGLTSSRSAPQSRASTTIWRLILTAINLALDQNGAETTTDFEQATELVLSTLTTLELIEVSASSDFLFFQDIEPFFEELEKFLSRPQLRHCNIDPVCCLLQYPLEVLVCCYACKIPADSVTESQLFLQRTKTVLEATRITDKDVSSRKTTEMRAFLEYLADEMLFKYDYINRERCVHVLEVIQLSLH